MEDLENGQLTDILSVDTPEKTPEEIEAERIAAEKEADRLLVAESQRPKALELVRYVEAMGRFDRGAKDVLDSSFEPEAVAWARGEWLKEQESLKPAEGGGDAPAPVRPAARRRGR